MMKPVMHFILLASLLFCSLVTGTKIDSHHQQQQQSSSAISKNDSQKNELRAQSRNSESDKKTNYKAVADMHSIYQQHLIGPNVASAIQPYEKNSDKRDLWSRFSSKEASTSEANGKKGRLQTVGSVIGDIIGVLVSEIARFFGSVVSDVAREVTAHGFVSLFKQIADLTGISRNSNHGHGTATAG
uniref:Uncharacterized protein LOC113796626 n=1 Tax=Dermatophagoides pteronyssinus TaxID=6956 RepID=A0A6P6YBB7_DERPT|nr:uncharacterized protein LOC113796626 [Dermatophagoides pteronyssinus]